MSVPFNPIQPPSGICPNCKEHKFIGHGPLCLQYALDNGIHEGVWGGTTETDRKKLANRPKYGPICTVDGCDGEHHSHGLCNKHAARTRRTAA